MITPKDFNIYYKDTIIRKEDTIIKLKEYEHQVNDFSIKVKAYDIELKEDVSTIIDTYSLQNIPKCGIYNCTYSVFYLDRISYRSPKKTFYPDHYRILLFNNNRQFSWIAEMNDVIFAKLMRFIFFQEKFVFPIQQLFADKHKIAQRIGDTDFFVSNGQIKYLWYKKVRVGRWINPGKVRIINFNFKNDFNSKLNKLGITVI